MAELVSPDESQQHLQHMKRETALRSLLAASAITLLKVITGVATGSLGMLSEAAHSGIDLLASTLTLLSLRVADRPADEEHTYGHGRVESLSAFVETIFMLASSVWIIYEGVVRLLRYRHGEPIALSVSPWPVLVLVLSIAVDWTRSKALHRAAEQAHSQALQAEALHFGTDIWSSMAVLLGLIAAFAGQRFGIRGLELADPIAALVVSVIILRVTWSLARETVDALLDKTTPETREAMAAAVARVPGVVSVDRLRMRRSGGSYFADVTVGMARTITFQRSEQLVSAVTEAVKTVLPATDVIVRTVPVAGEHESVFERVRAVAARADLSVHDVSLQQVEHGLQLEQHLELPAETLLRDAHETASGLEAEMRREVPEIRSVITHIESEEQAIAHPGQIAHDPALLTQLRQTAKGWPEICDVHDMTGIWHGDKLELSCHCTLPDSMRIDAVHAVISALEAAFLRQHPEVTRVLIHPEPATDNRR
ncbi:cation diffusion facilitator family transporter [Terriglobus sp.]|uniref:cation diffusion facilitator family transporter n=1 Tax=Terriglobus sp. TaxID=1889013 RepID=UPI003AFFE33B